MNRTLQRLTFAFCVSTTGSLASWSFYHSGTKKPRRQSDQPAIAKLDSHINSVERRNLSDLMWEGLIKGEDLYIGESIRTTENAEARILFLNSGTALELEPETEIVLEETAEGATINFLKGNLFVKKVTPPAGTGSPGQALAAVTLKSGANTIDISSAELAASKKTSTEVDLQVFKGKAEVIKADGQKVEIDNSKTASIGARGVAQVETDIKVTSPVPGDPIFINKKNLTPVTFKWDKLPAGYRVFLEGGRRRAQLKRYEQFSAPGESGELNIPMKAGKFFYRLVAVPNKPDLASRSSPILPGEILVQSPPLLLAPADRLAIAIEADSPPLEFKWTKTVSFSSYFIEVASDAKLTKKVAEQRLPRDAELFSFKAPASGQYFWRVTGALELGGKPTAISSDVQSFQVTIGARLVAPKLKSPMPEQGVSATLAFDPGVTFTWEPTPGADKYLLKLRGLDPATEVRTETAIEPQARIAGLVPGKYEWTLSSAAGPEKISPPSEPRLFTVLPIPEITWSKVTQSGKYFYISEKPQLQASWEPTEGATSWRIRWAAKTEIGDRAEKSEPPWITLNQPKFQTEVPEDGTYSIEVEALGPKDQTLARSSSLDLLVKEKPLLPAPRFPSSVPEIIQSSRSGDVRLNWNVVEGARQYRVEVRNAAGKVLRQETVNSPTAAFSKLPPGQYKVTVRSLDENMRLSQSESARMVTVPEVSQVMAPKIKGIKVK